MNNITQKILGQLEFFPTNILNNDEVNFKILKEAEVLGLENFLIYSDNFSLTGFKQNICMLISYPLGKQQNLVKAADANYAINMGANEVAIQLNPAYVVEENDFALMQEIITIKEALSDKNIRFIIGKEILLNNMQKDNFIKNMQVFNKLSANRIQLDFEGNLFDQVDFIKSLLQIYPRAEYFLSGRLNSLDEMLDLLLLENCKIIISDLEQLKEFIATLNEI